MTRWGWARRWLEHEERRRLVLARLTAYALLSYGVVALVVVLALGAVGSVAFAQLDRLQGQIGQELSATKDALRAISQNIGDATIATQGFSASIEAARQTTNTASSAASDAATTFRAFDQQIRQLPFGLAAVAPQFARAADELQRVADALAATQAPLQQNVTDVNRLSQDLAETRRHVDRIASLLPDQGSLGFLFGWQRLALRVTFYGTVLLFLLQAIYCLVVGAIRYRQLQRELAQTSLSAEDTHPNG